MKKLPDISFAEWVEAEKSLALVEPRPKHTINTTEYAAATNRSISRAREVLREMTRKGLAEKIKWHNGANLYRLKVHGKKSIR